MAEQYGYFNGLAYDEDFPAQRIAALVPNGVYQNGSQVLADGSMKLQVTPGRAWINGYFYRSDEAVEVTVPTAHPSLPRKDAVVLRWDLPEKVMGVCVVEGTPANNPQPPALRRDSQVYDLQLALVKVETGAIALTQSAVQDTRTDKAVCGYTQGFDQMDFSQLMAQLDAWAEEYRTGKNEEFQRWFDTIKDQLTDNVAGSLQAQINQITESKGQPGGIAGQDALQALADSRGQADGIATLDGAGKLAQMPTAGDVGADAAGSAAAVQTALGSHTGNKQNPHGVTATQVGAALAGHTHTAAQVGAVPLSGGNASISGGLTAGGTVRANYFCASAGQGLRYQKDAATQTEIIFGNGGNTYLPNQNVYATYQMFQNNGKPVGDYEVGSWTPNCAQLNISSKSGRYVRVGKIVYVQFEICISSTNTSGSELDLYGLPFMSDSIGIGNLFYTNVCFYANGVTSNPSPSVFPGCYASNTHFKLMGFWDGRPWTLSSHEVSGSGGAIISGGIVYRIA